MTSSTVLIDSMEAHPLLTLLVLGIAAMVWWIYIILDERKGAKSK